MGRGRHIIQPLSYSYRRKDQTLNSQKRVVIAIKTITPHEYVGSNSARPKAVLVVHSNSLTLEHSSTRRILHLVLFQSYNYEFIQLTKSIATCTASGRNYFECHDVFFTHNYKLHQRYITLVCQFQTVYFITAATLRHPYRLPTLPSSASRRPPPRPRPHSFRRADP